jgi:hypothetical protein
MSIALTPVSTQSEQQSPYPVLSSSNPSNPLQRFSLLIHILLCPFPCHSRPVPVLFPSRSQIRPGCKCYARTNSETSAQLHRDFSESSARSQQADVTVHQTQTDKLNYTMFFQGDKLKHTMFFSGFKRMSIHKKFQHLFYKLNHTMFSPCSSQVFPRFLWYATQRGCDRFKTTTQTTTNDLLIWTLFNLSLSEEVSA